MEDLYTRRQTIYVSRNDKYSLNKNDFKKNYKSYSEQCKDAKMDLRKIARFEPGVYYYNKQRCDEAKNEFLE